MYNQFNVGDRVVMIKNNQYCPAVEGSTGTVLRIKPIGVLVKWDLSTLAETDWGDEFSVNSKYLKLLAKCDTPPPPVETKIIKKIKELDKAFAFRQLQKKGISVCV